MHSMKHSISNNEQGFGDPYKNEPFLDHYKNEVGGKIVLSKNSTHKEGGVGRLEVRRGSSLKGDYNKGSGKKVRRRSSLGTSSNYNKENSADKTRTGGENRRSNNSSQEPRSARRRGRRQSISGGIDTSVDTANTSANNNRSNANANNNNTETNDYNNYNDQSSQSHNHGAGRERPKRRGRRNSISGVISGSSGSSGNTEKGKSTDEYDDDSASIFSDPYSNKPFLQKAKLRMEFPNTRLKGVVVSPSEEEQQQKEKEQHQHSSSASSGRKKGSGRRQRRNSIGVCNNVEGTGADGSGSRPDPHRQDSYSTSNRGGGGRDKSSAKVGADFIKSLSSSSHHNKQEEPQQRRSRRRRSSIAGSTVPVASATIDEHHNHDNHNPVVRASPRRIRRGSMSNATNTSSCSVATFNGVSTPSIATNGNSSRSLINNISNSSPTKTSPATQQHQPCGRRRRNSIGASSIPSSTTASPLASVKSIVSASSKRNILKSSRASAASSSTLGYGSSSGSSSVRGGFRKTSRRRASIGTSTNTTSSDTKKYRNGINTYTIDSYDNTDDSQIREALLEKMCLLNKTMDEFNDAANKRLSTVIDLEERIKKKRIEYEAGLDMDNEGSSSNNSVDDCHSHRSHNHDRHVQKMEQFYKKTYRDNTKKINRLKKDNKDKAKNLSKLGKELERRIESNDRKFKKNNSLVSNYQSKADKIQTEVMVVTTLKDGLSCSVNNLSEENKELANSVDEYQRLCENESLVRLEFQKTVFDVAQLVRMGCESKSLKKEIKSIILRCDKSSKKIINSLTKHHGKRFEIIKDSSYASSYYSAASS